MAIEIRQLVIRAVVTEPARPPAGEALPRIAPAPRTPSSTPLDAARLRQTIAAACAREVERQLRRSRAR